MKTIVSLLVLLAFVCAIRAAESAAAPILFERDGYLFVATGCVAEPAKEGMQRIRLTVSYEVPAQVHFILLASKNPAGTLADSFSFRVIEGTTKGQVLMEFERDAEGRGFYLSLWRGIGGGSPSGAVCDGVFIELPLKITPFIHHQ